MASGWPAKSPAHRSGQRLPQVTCGWSSCEAAERARIGGPRNKLLADGGAGLSSRLSQCGPGRIFRAHQRQAAQARLLPYRDQGRQHAIPSAAGRTASKLARTGPVPGPQLQYPCHISRPALARGVLRFCSSQFHSSIDEALALSHRVGVTASRLIGCTPRPTGTALTMSSDSSSQIDLPLPAVAGA
jgi:hypothetical protein